MSRPDVLVAGDGDNVAVRGADGQLHLLSARRGRFDAEIWLRRDGDSREVASVAKERETGFVCDGAGCLAAIGGRHDHLLLAVLSAEALAEDCAKARIVVDLARGWRPPCVGPTLVVTQRLLRQEGAIEARLSDGRIVWTSVARERGQRPWTGGGDQ
jgi:competence protein ComEC